MIRAIAKYFQGIPSMFIDGALYFLIAVFMFLQAQFGSDEAGKFIELEPLFWIKTFVGAVSAGLLAVKLFRSNEYAEHKRAKNGDTAFLNKKDLP